MRARRPPDRLFLLVVVVLLLLVAVAGSCGGKKERVDPARAHALLDEYVETVRAMGRGNALDALEPLLVEQLAKAKAMNHEGALPDAVFRRYQRLVEVTRAIVAPHPGAADKETVSAFLDDALGTRKERALTGGMAEVGPALVEEVLTLHMLLDGTSDREEARARYLGELGH